MKLKQTRALMQRKLEETAFDAFGILIGCKGEEEAFFSENANEDTLFDIASCGKVLHTVPLALQAIGEGRLSLDSVLDERCGLPCHRPETPGMCTFKGMARILQDRKLSDLTVRPA